MNKRILVTGDSICDHNYYRGRRSTADSPEPRGFRHKTAAGGALLLKELIEQVTGNLPGWKTEFGLNDNFETLPATHHAFCLWEPQVMNPDEKDAGKQIQVWRAVEPPLGYGHPELFAQPDETAKQRPEAILGHDDPTAASPEIIVVDDAGLGFRNLAAKKHWPFSKVNKKLKWVVLKLTGSVGEGDLWKEIVKHCHEKLVVIVPADQLRQHDIRISRGLSWEATAEDLAAELLDNPALQPLLAARYSRGRWTKHCDCGTAGAANVWRCSKGTANRFWARWR